MQTIEIRGLVLEAVSGAGTLQPSQVALRSAVVTSDLAQNQTMHRSPVAQHQKVLLLQYKQLHYCQNDVLGAVPEIR